MLYWLVMISLTKVTKKFGSSSSAKTAVDNISFNTSRREIIGFVGPNGAGKTTTMRLIVGYLQPTAGKISVDGLSPKDERIKVLKKIGYLPENNPLYQEMKVREYLEFIARVKGVDYKAQVEEVGLAQIINTKIEELSRGFKQRVGLAAALIGNPQILILDEPTSGLDPLEQDKIKNLIKKLKKLIIFSTHILSEVEDIATRIIIVNRGLLVYDGKKPKGKGAVEKLFKKLVK